VSKVFDANGAFISPGWFDMRAALREPGYEFKEDLHSAAQAATAGGFTGIACLPDTLPAIQTKSDIEFIYRKAEELPVHIFPYGAITRNRSGEELNELFDMHQAGAIGFTDGNKSIAHAGVMLRALMYGKIFDGLICSHCEDADIAAGGRMHEGAMSTSLGLKGITPIAEELMIIRDLELAKYAGSPVHIAHISSKGSVDIIRKAKKQGVPVTCDVAVANLIFTDEELKDFDSNYKLTPPLRGKSDQKALWEGLMDGTIDCIVTDHHPEDPEHKEVEFEYAAPGMIQLQTAYALLNMKAPKTFTTDMLVQAISINPRHILGLDPLKIEKGARAELTVFDANHKWTYDVTTNRSRSKNSPVLHTELTGKAIAIVNKDQFFRN
jgi:dihydroorotase